jgi:hypothetical protein
MWAVGGISILIGVVVALSACAYTLYIWWGVISDLEFISFILSIFLFFLSIPLSPLYLGVNGNWEPTFLIVIGLVGGTIIMFIGAYINAYSELKSYRRFEEREKKPVKPLPKIKLDYWFDKPLSLRQTIIWLFCILSPLIYLSIEVVSPDEVMLNFVSELARILLDLLP